MSLAIKLRAERLEKAANYSAFLGITVSILGMALTIAYSSSGDGRRLGEEVAYAEATASDLLVANTRTQAKITALERDLRALQTAGSTTSPTPLQLNRVTSRLAEIEERQQRIEDAISRDPAKALELPLLRRDLDNIKTGQSEDIEELRQQIAQVYDLNKWLLGGGSLSLFAIALSMILGRLKGKASE